MFMIILNVFAGLVGISYIAVITYKIVKYKRNNCFSNKVLVYINKKNKQTSYIEELGRKMTLIVGIVTLIITTMMIIINLSDESVKTNIVPLLSPIMLLNLWYLSYNQSKSSFITEEGIVIGINFYKWKKVKAYQIKKLFDSKKKVEMQYLKLKVGLFPIQVVVDDRGEVEKLLKELSSN